MRIESTNWVRGVAFAAVLVLPLANPLRADDAEELKKLVKEYQTLYDAGEYKKAEPIARQMVEIAEKSEKPQTVVPYLGSLGAVYRRLGRYAEAEPLYKRALAIREKVLGPDHLSVAISLDDLGNLYKDLSQLTKAEEYQKRALAMREKALPPDHLDVARSLNNLAEVYRLQARLGEAAQLYQRALAIFEKKLGPDHKTIGKCLNNLAVVYVSQARYAEAETLYQRALAIREKNLGPDHPEVVQTVNNLGNMLKRQGKYAEAEPLIKRALATREKVFGPDHPSVADTVDDLAGLYSSQGRCTEAEAMYKRALAARLKTLPPGHPSVANSLNNLATLYKKLGRYADAEPLYKQSLAIREKALRPEHTAIAQSLENLAALQHNQARYKEAAALYKRALAIREKTLGPDHPSLVAPLGNLALLDELFGRYAKAEAALSRALAIDEKAFGRDHPEVAVTLGNLATVYIRQKRYDEAETLLKRALAIQEKIWGPDHIDVAISLGGLVDLYQNQKRYADAEALVNRAIAIFDRGGSTPSRRARAYRQRAELQWSLDRKKEAIADLKRSMDLAEEQRAMGSGGERERAQLFARFSGAFDRMVDWQATLGDLGAALDAMERSRARSLLEQIETHDIDLLAGVPKKQAAALRRREAEVQSRVASLEKQLQLLDERKDLSADERKRQAETLRADLRKAHADYVVVYADIRNASPAYRLAVGQDHKPVSLEKLGKWAADQNAVLLEYCLGRGMGYVLVVRPGVAPRLEKLVLSEQQARALGIDAAETPTGTSADNKTADAKPAFPLPLTNRRLGMALSNKKGTGILQLLKRANNLTQAKEAAAGLAVLWDVLIPAAEQTALQEGKLQRLAVIPDGPLSSLPFETLVIRLGENPQYLLDVGPPIEYAPSATILMNLAERQRSGDEERSPVLTVGDVRYGKPSAGQRGDALADLNASSRYASLGGSLSDLPFTKLEVAWVAQVFGKTGVKVTELLRDRATEANVCRDAKGRKILHLACHGLVDQAYGNLFGALALTPGLDASKPADDGFLTLAEIYTLHLEKTELAILSACDTNYGPQQEGEGVYALSRGFLVAGARRVVASNWLVDDEAGASLISRFCGELATAEKKGGPVDYAAALHRAKRWVRQQENWANPYFWGTFVLVGPN